MDGFPTTLEATTGGTDFFSFMSGVIDKGVNYLTAKEAADAQRQANTVKVPYSTAGMPEWVMPVALIGGAVLVAVLILKK